MSRQINFASSKTKTEFMTSEEWYRKGNLYRKQQDWQHAIDCYLEAIELDPESPAKNAKEMLDNILNFYCKDCYNP
jgi:tetratricopeptide (TPR) repeat protein